MTDFSETAELAAKREDMPSAEGHLTVDVFQTEDEVIVQSTIAGIKSPTEEVDIAVTKDMVTIRGSRQPDHNIKPDDYFHREIYWGPFSKQVILPVDVDADNAKATYRNGVLTVRLPKLEKIKTKKVKISP